MKKTYKRPAMIVVIVDTQEMICESMTKDSQTIISSKDDVLSRRDRGSFWDEEEE